MSGKQKAWSILLVSIAAATVTTAQAAPATAVRKDTTMTGTFTLTHGTNVLRATLVDAPPVYNPGGPVCFVENWPDDESLLTDAEQEAAKRRAVVVRVICPHAATARAAALTRRGYTVASEWYTAPLPLMGTLPLHGIRSLTAADVPRVLELGEQKRREYEAYSPVFWRVSSLPRATFAPYMQAQIADAQNIALAHEQNGKVDGFVLVNARGTIDDCTVAAPDLWPTVGAKLLTAAGNTAHQHGLKSLLVICGHGDTPKRTMLAEQGLTLATDWYVKAIKPTGPEKK